VNGLVLEDFNIEPKYLSVDVFIKKAGVFTILKTKYFTLKWDGATRLYITAHRSLMNKMKGLCGNYDGDATNDKT
jgi:hypothetical protein